MVIFPVGFVSHASNAEETSPNSLVLKKYGTVGLEMIIKAAKTLASRQIQLDLDTKGGSLCIQLIGVPRSLAVHDLQNLLDTSKDKIGGGYKAEVYYEQNQFRLRLKPVTDLLSPSQQFFSIDPYAAYTALILGKEGFKEIANLFGGPDQCVQVVMNATESLNSTDQRKTILTAGLGGCTASALCLFDGHKTAIILSHYADPSSPRVISAIQNKLKDLNLGPIQKSTLIILGQATLIKMEGEKYYSLDLSTEAKEHIDIVLRAFPGTDLVRETYSGQWRSGDASAIALTIQSDQIIKVDLLSNEGTPHYVKSFTIDLSHSQ